MSREDDIEQSDWEDILRDADNYYDRSDEAEDYPMLGRRIIEVPKKLTEAERKKMLRKCCKDWMKKCKKCGVESIFSKE